MLQSRRRGFSGNSTYPKLARPASVTEVPWETSPAVELVVEQRLEVLLGLR